MIRRQAFRAHNLLTTTSKIISRRNIPHERSNLGITNNILKCGFCSTNNNNNDDEKKVNKKLHDEYSGLFPRIAAVSTILETARPEFEKVKQTTVWYATSEKSPPDTIARQLIVFADLQVG